MNASLYEGMRHFADSWGLVYMMAVFLVVVALLLRPGATAQARSAAQIPLADDRPAGEEDRQ